MLFRQFVDEDLGCASYLIADEGSKEAVVVDPAYEIGHYLAAAEANDLHLTRVLETHTHADHVSGHGRLALEFGVPVCVHREARAVFEHEPLAEGDELEVGSLRVRVLHTPGHRPEHCCFLVGDTLLTGDSLFVGATARPDLAVEAREGAEGLFHSLQRLFELPDGVRVFPGHVAGSLCGKGMSSDPCSTIGHERTFNAAFALATVDEFVADSTAATGVPRPPNMERIVELNRGAFLGASTPLEAADSASEATVLDVRPVDEYVRGHVAGALNVPVGGGSFGTKAGFVLDGSERVVLHASSPEEAQLAGERLRAVGFLELEGYLSAPDTSEGLSPVTIEELEGLLASDSVTVVDVRENDERDAAQIPGSLHLPYRVLRACADCVPNGRPIVTICESGARAGIAASILAAAGHEVRPVLHGGIAEWRARGNQTVAFRRCGGG